MAVASFSFTIGTASEPEQRRERVPGVDVRGALGDVSGGEEDLRRLDAVPSERGIPRGLQAGLAEGRGGLELRDARRSPGQAESGQAERDRAGGDDDRRRSSLDQLGDLASPVAEQCAPQPAAVCRDQARAELDDDRAFSGHRCCVPSPTIRYWRSQRSRYVTGPRGPGSRPTLIPVSGALVSSKPSTNLVDAFQAAAVPR